MHFDFFTQRKKDEISQGDEIAVYADREDFLESGRYTVAQLAADDENNLFATLVGMGPIEGTITELCIGRAG